MLPLFKDIKLFIATPFYEVKAYSPYCKCLIDSARVLWTLGLDFIFHTHNGDSYVDRARNTICAKFLESDCTDLLFIDSDMTWNLDAIGMMLLPPQEVVGAVYPMKNQWGHYGVALNTHENGSPIVDPITGLLSAEWVMAGFLRIKRTALEKMAEAYKDLAYQDPNADPANPTRKYIPFFELKLGKSGEDITFCRRWKAIGGEVWVEPRITFGHYGIQVWTGNYHEFLMRQPGGSKHGLKTVMVSNFNACVPDLSSYFDVVGLVSEEKMKSLDAAVIWNDETERDRVLCKQLQKNGVPVFVMLHGISGRTMYDPSNLDMKPVADHYLVWSSREKDLIVKQGCSEENVTVVGSPLFRGISHNPNGKKVVYYPAGGYYPMPEHLHQNSLKVWEKLRAMEGVEPVVKLLFNEHPLDEYDGKKVVSNRVSPDHVDLMYEALKDASCLVTDEGGTHVLAACYLDIPIVKITNDLSNCFPEIVRESNIEQMEEAVRFVLKKPRDKRKQRQEFKRRYEHGDCAKNIHKAVMRVLNGSKP